MSHPTQPTLSAGRPVALSSARPNEQPDFPDLSATLRPPPAPISTSANPFFRNAVSLPSSPTLRERFMHTSSKVVRLVDVRSTPTHLLWSLFTHACTQASPCPHSLHPRPQISHPLFQNKIPPPTPMFAHSGSANAPPGGIWAVFSSHEDARAALNLGCDIFSVSPALESDLVSLPVLERFDMEHLDRHAPQRHPNNYLSPLTIQDLSATQDIYSTGGLRSPFGSRPSGQASLVDPLSNGAPPFTISSNPPNPKTSFRAGDWMCSAPNCSAHNFQRNITCIVCGRPRSGGAPPLAADQAHPPNYALANPSPRFASRYNGTQSAPQTPLTSMPSTPSFHRPSNATAAIVAAPHAHTSAKAPPPQYPPLTPSGRALAVGGRVRNISRDPLSPCVMYWPDNEPLPEPCQIRPIDSALITYPPIINTGNKGAAEKQPGDWICGKCNYHNWRRRKVCQTCYPYAEGNGDSISAAVQAERIALLANVLATQFNTLDLNGLASQPTASQPNPPDGALPLYARNSAANGTNMLASGYIRGGSRDSSPSSERFSLLPPLALSEHEKDALPIYQTSGIRGPVRAPGPDMVHSPSLSPSSASSSSAELSLDGSSEDAHYASSSGTSTHSHTHHAPPSAGGQQQQHGLYGMHAQNASTSSFSSLSNGGAGANSIWRFDGEETRTLSSSTGNGSGSGSGSPSGANSGPSIMGPTPVPGSRYARHPSPSSRQTVDFPTNTQIRKNSSPRASEATTKSTNDFWQVRYN
ncbi:hypothetical protein BD414DRAFT_540266 [Trametes punicea]|nr:hypothetical protein BD414DRAFT_540266 [Trametes punicea]